MAESRVYGYARVSSKEQNLDRQIEALLQAGVKQEFIREDKQSGKDFNRIAYQYLMSELRSGDTVIIKELDRLGRDAEAIKNEWAELINRGVKIKVLDMPILNTGDKDGLGNLISNIVLELLSYVAQSEREKIRQRQDEGIKLAKGRGTHLGRPRIDFPNKFEIEYKRWKAGEIRAVDCMVLMGLSKSTFYRLVCLHEKQLQGSTEVSRRTATVL